MKRILAWFGLVSALDLLLAAQKYCKAQEDLQMTILKGGVKQEDKKLIEQAFYNSMTEGAKSIGVGEFINSYIK